MRKNIIISCYFLFFFLLSFRTLAQNPRVDGYKGIWFSSTQNSEYGTKYSGGLGTYSAEHVPTAIYSDAAKKTFFVYGGTTNENERHLLIMISYFDHKTHKVPKPVIVLDKMGVNDPRDNASLSIDGSGYLWVFVSGRGRTRPGFIFKSIKPLSIDGFENVYRGELIYPQPWWVAGGGFINLFSKHFRGRELYFTTSADGKMWSSAKEIAGFGGHFQVSNMYGNHLVTVFNYHPGGDIDKQTNLYALQTDDMGKTWKTIGGVVVNIPLTDKHNGAIIKDYEAEKKLVYLNDINFDRDGNPVILIVTSSDFKPGPVGDPREWIVINWKNGKWNFHKVCESTHNYDMGSLIIEENSWKIIGPTDKGPQKFGTGGEVAVWLSRDEGLTWNKDRFITSNSSRNNSFVRRPLNAQDDFYTLWADGDADKFSESHIYFSNKKGNKVWLLPYNMERDLEKPVRIR